MTIALMALASTACHTDAFGPAFYGPDSPLHPGTEAQLTFNPGNKYGYRFHADAVSWSEDGTGIVYAFGPRPYQPGESLGLRCAVFCTSVSRDSLDTCVATLPPGGGSAYWQVCDERTAHTDSIDIISAPAVSRAGQLLYVELTQQTDLPVGLRAHRDLWLGDPMNPQVRRRLLSGVSLADIQWAGANTFFARDNGVMIGSIAPDTVVLRGVPGTGSAISYAVIDGGRSVVTVSGDSLIRRVLVADGTVVSAVLPLTTGGRTLDVSCGARACIVLTVDGSPVTWTIWKLDLATGITSAVRTFSHAIAAAKLSPASGRIVTLEGRNLFLLSDVVQ